MGTAVPSAWAKRVQAEQEAKPKAKPKAKKTGGK